MWLQIESIMDNDGCFHVGKNESDFKEVGLVEGGNVLVEIISHGYEFVTSISFKLSSRVEVQCRFYFILL